MHGTTVADAAKGDPNRQKAKNVQTESGAKVIFDVLGAFSQKRFFALLVVATEEPQVSCSS